MGAEKRSTQGSARRPQRLNPLSFPNQIAAPFDCAQGRLSRRALIGTCTARARCPPTPASQKRLLGTPALATAGGTPALRWGVPRGAESVPRWCFVPWSTLKWSSQPDQVTKGNTKVVCTIGGENGILVSG